MNTNSLFKVNYASVTEAYNQDNKTQFCETRRANIGFIFL